MKKDSLTIMPLNIRLNIFHMCIPINMLTIFHRKKNITNTKPKKDNNKELNIRQFKNKLYTEDKLKYRQLLKNHKTAYNQESSVNLKYIPYLSHNFKPLKSFSKYLYNNLKSLYNNQLFKPQLSNNYQFNNLKLLFNQDIKQFTNHKQV